jgi:hypothetical protein
MISDLVRRLLAVRGDCFECGSTGVLHELDGQRVRMVPTARLRDVRRSLCHVCKISEAEWLDLKQRAAVAEQVAAAPKQKDS